MAMEHFTTVIEGAFAILNERVNGASNGALHTARKNALANLLTTGMPTPRHEEWKYTNLAPILANDFLPAIGPSLPVTSSILEGLTRWDFDTWRIVLVNGVMQRDLSSLPPDATRIAIEEFSDDVPGGHIASTEAYPFVAVNASLLSGGVVIRIRANSIIDTPIHVCSIVQTDVGNTISMPRIFVQLEHHAVCTVIETHHTVGRSKGLSASVTEIDCAEGSSVAYTKILDDGTNGHHIGTTAVNIARSAKAVATTACLDGAFVRNDVIMRLNEPSAEAYLYGVSVLNDAQVADNHTVVDHAAPHCHSEELYKGLYDGRSVGVFNGKIFVREDAQKTTAYQSNHSLLLSDNAVVNAKPQLEIWADDVKCSHGATTGQLNEEAVFYLQSRGIGKDEARGLLTYAFAADVAEHIEHAGVRELIERRIAEKLNARQFDR
ncbi:Fe-S cluster assembly protein SufD [soil metagenome]